MNTIHSEQTASKALLDAEQVNTGERIRGIDGWIITVHERAAGVTMTRRFEIVANTAVNSTAAKTVTLVCSEEELAGFRLACAEAARAELERTNPLAGLRHYRTAMLAFPFLPGLDVLRDQLMSGAGNVVEASLQTASECLKQRRTWAAARPALERVKPLIEIEDALHVAFGARHALLQSLAGRLEKLAQRTLPHDEALALLRDLRDELADDPESEWHTSGWRSLRDRLKRLEAASQQKTGEMLFALRRQFMADATRAYQDVSASQFLEPFFADGLPPDEEIASLQLEEAETLLRRAGEFLHMHEAAEAEGESMQDAIALLHEETSRLAGWRRDLNALIKACGMAGDQAVSGLREPVRFDVARYLLGSGGRAPATPLHQAPAMFIGHPSWLRCKAFVDECVARRAAQERWFREINVCLQHDAATRPDQLPAKSDECVRTLRSQLQSEPPIYPIEIALGKMRAMKHEEPVDVCGLQSDLTYVDSDDHRREHRTLPAIEAVVQRKVDQIDALRDWLMQFSRTGVDFPGVVDWPQEQHAIETLRNSGPAGLTEAQARCKLARDGGNDGALNGLWPLARMCNALAQESALAHLRQMLGDANVQKLCAPARALNQQRQALWLAHENQLRECDALAKDIAARIERYPSAWDAFEMAHRALMTMPVWRRRRIAHSAEWQGYQQAAEAFNHICPDYSAFRARLHEVKARFHLVPACLDETEKHHA